MITLIAIGLISFGAGFLVSRLLARRRTSSDEIENEDSTDAAAWAEGLAIIALLILAIAGAISIGVWSDAKWLDGFEWSHALEALTGLGTLLLALATAWLGATTRAVVRSGEVELTEVRKQVKASVDQTESVRAQTAATRSLAEAQDRPFIVPMPWAERTRTPANQVVEIPRPIRFAQFQGSQKFSMRLWNIGHATGIVEKISLQIGTERWLLPHGEEIIVTDFASRDTDRHFEFPDGPLADVEGTLRLHFRDAIGRHYVTESNIVVASDGTATCTKRILWKVLEDTEIRVPAVPAVGS